MLSGLLRSGESISSGLHPLSDEKKHISSHVCEGMRCHVRLTVESVPLKFPRRRLDLRSFTHQHVPSNEKSLSV